MSFNIQETLSNNKVVLAPMAGITDSAFRLICREFGAGIVYSEMISADGIVHENTNSLRLLYFKENEHPLGIQLFGKSPEVIAEAGRYVSRFSPDFIDVNLGCPMRKVVNNNGGSALMRDLNLLERIFKRLVSAISIPITAKIRSGWSNQELNAVEVSQLLEECGVKAIAVHGRTKNMMFTGKADWSIIKAVKSSVKIPVIGNGDVKSPEDAKRMLDETGCDAVMIGRASFGNPWIFKRINHYLLTGTLLPEPTIDEKINVCVRHLKLMVADKGEYVGVREMRKHINWYIKGLRNASELRLKIMKEEKMDNVIKLLMEFINKDL